MSDRWSFLDDGRIDVLALCRHWDDIANREAGLPRDLPESGSKVCSISAMLGRNESGQGECLRTPLTVASTSLEGADNGEA